MEFTMRQLSQFRAPVLSGMAALLLTACVQTCTQQHRDMTAEEVVEAYLQIALNIESIEEKQDLLELTTGDLEAAIAGTTEETFAAAYIDRKYTLDSYSLIERRDRTPRETEITFQLQYLDHLDAAQAGEAKAKNKKESGAKVTTENTVSVIKEKDRWLIREVIGAKTTFDFPVADAAKITPRSKEEQLANPIPEGAVEEN